MYAIKIHDFLLVTLSVREYLVKNTGKASYFFPECQRWVPQNKLNQDSFTFVRP